MPKITIDIPQFTWDDVQRAMGRWIMTSEELGDMIDALPIPVRDIVRHAVDQSMETPKIQTAADVLDWVAGNTEAFDRLTRDHAQSLHSILRNYIRGREGA